MAIEDLTTSAVNLLEAGQQAIEADQPHYLAGNAGVLACSSIDRAIRRSRLKACAPRQRSWCAAIEVFAAALQRQPLSEKSKKRTKSAGECVAPGAFGPSIVQGSVAG